MPTIEDYADDSDPEDLPLPSQPLPTTSRGPILESVDSARRAPPATAPSPGPSNEKFVTDASPYKKWTCVYPIYIDAKRPYGTGQRRVERPKSVWWPLSKDIADASTRLGLPTAHEMSKAHPRDWENPGRVRIQWKRDGKLINPNVQTKKQLLEMISFQIQRTKPENIPKPPYITAAVPAIAAPTPVAPATPAKGAPKGKQQPAILPKPSTAAAPVKPARKGVPIAPNTLRETFPSAAHLPSYSPAIPAGILIDTVKAGINATPEPAPAAPVLPVKGKQQQQQRKVVRMRG